MRITVTSHKGGVGKSMTAIHLAAFFAEHSGPESTLLVDADPNESALGWTRRGELPYRTTGPDMAGAIMDDYEHTIIDTQGRPRGRALERIVDGCDLLVVPTGPDAMALEALMLMAADLHELGGGAEYKVLLTIVPPWPVRSGATARSALQRRGIPIFDTEIKRREAFQKASIRGRPVYDIKDRRAMKGWQEYESVGKEILS